MEASGNKIRLCMRDSGTWVCCSANRSFVLCLGPDLFIVMVSWATFTNMFARKNSGRRRWFKNLSIFENTHFSVGEPSLGLDREVVLFHWFTFRLGLAVAFQTSRKYWHPIVQQECSEGPLAAELLRERRLGQKCLCSLEKPKINVHSALYRSLRDAWPTCLFLARMTKRKNRN